MPQKLPFVVILETMKVLKSVQGPINKVVQLRVTNQVQNVIFGHHCKRAKALFHFESVRLGSRKCPRLKESVPTDSGFFFLDLNILHCLFILVANMPRFIGLSRFS